MIVGMDERSRPLAALAVALVIVQADEFDGEP